MEDASYPTTFLAYYGASIRALEQTHWSSLDLTRILLFTGLALLALNSQLNR